MMVGGAIPVSPGFLGASGGSLIALSLSLFGVDTEVLLTFTLDYREIALLFPTAVSPFLLGGEGAMLTTSGNAVSVRSKVNPGDGGLPVSLSRMGDLGPMLFMGGVVLLLFAPYLLRSDLLIWPRSGLSSDVVHMYWVDHFLTNEAVTAGWRKAKQ